MELIINGFTFLGGLVAVLLILGVIGGVIACILQDRKADNPITISNLKLENLRLEKKAEEYKDLWIKASDQNGILSTENEVLLDAIALKKKKVDE